MSCKLSPPQNNLYVIKPVSLQALRGGECPKEGCHVDHPTGDGQHRFLELWRPVSSLVSFRY